MSDTNTPNFGVFGPGEALQLLWCKSYRCMSAQELRWFADGAASFVREFSRQMERVLIDVACLVAVDGSSETPGAGNLQNHGDVSNLLFSVANQLSLLRGMAEIGDEASGMVIDGLEKQGRAA